jgi:hypothetical protein
VFQAIHSLVIKEIKMQTRARFRSTALFAFSSYITVSCVEGSGGGSNTETMESCGQPWCIIIPDTPNGKAWGDDVGTDVAVKEVKDGVLGDIARCVCMTPEEDDLLTAGCAVAPCNPVYNVARAEVVALTYEACVAATVDSYDPDLSQNPGLVGPGRNTCLEASAYWVPSRAADSQFCSVPSNECPGGETTGEGLGDDGAGPEPYLSYSIPCGGGVCTVPEGLLEALEANPTLLLHSGTRLSQSYSGSVANGLKFTGIVVNSLAYRLGFRNNDVISAVDSQSLLTVDDALDVFRILRHSGTATVKVKRSTNTIYLNFERENWP